MKRKRRPARRPSAAASPVREKVLGSAQAVPRAAPAIPVSGGQPETPRRRLGATLALVGLFVAVAAGGIVAMTLGSRWVSPDDLLQFSIAGLSVALFGAAGVYFAFIRRDTRLLPYVLRTICDTVPVFVALVAVNVAIARQISRTPAAEADVQLREQVERLSAERKDLMKALFAAGKFETQVDVLKTKLMEQEASLTAFVNERTQLRGELDRMKAQLASEQSASKSQSAQARADLEAKAQRLALLETALRDGRLEFQSIQEDLKRGRKVTEARVLKALSKLPAEAAASPN